MNKFEQQPKTEEEQAKELDKLIEDLKIKREEEKKNYKTGKIERKQWRKDKKKSR